MAADSLADAVQRLTPPWRGAWFESVESTQDVARLAAERGAPGRSVFVADVQRAGRGRNGRIWLAQPGAALLMSILFRQDGAPSRPWRYTSLAALALLQSSQSFLSRGRLAIKWPNDLMLDDCKVAGVLAEATWHGDHLHAIVGIGLNVAAAPDLPQTVALAAYADQPIDRGNLFLSYIDRVERWLHEAPDHLHATWQQHLWGRGQRLRLADLGRTEEVVVVGVEHDGALQVELADGTRQVTTTGELLI
jgi:BirA family biotin operon repressor/biotin-[acetyl-CoA-carboxylase] ligase